MNWKYTIFNLSFIGKINSINKLCTIFLPGLAQIEKVMPALTQQLENCLSCMNVDYITDYSCVHGQNLSQASRCYWK